MFFFDFFKYGYQLFCFFHLIIIKLNNLKKNFLHRVIVYLLISKIEFDFIIYLFNLIPLLIFFLNRSYCWVVFLRLDKFNFFNFVVKFSCL